MSPDYSYKGYEIVPDKLNYELSYVAYDLIESHLQIIPMIMRMLGRLFLLRKYYLVTSWTVGPMNERYRVSKNVEMIRFSERKRVKDVISGRVFPSLQSQSKWHKRSAYKAELISY